jgi:hypothetical protein
LDLDSLDVDVSTVLLALAEIKSLDEIADDEAALEMDEIVDETEDESEDEAAVDDAAGMLMMVTFPNDTAGNQASPVQSLRASVNSHSSPSCLSPCALRLDREVVWTSRADASETRARKRTRTGRRDLDRDPVGVEVGRRRRMGEEFAKKSSEGAVGHGEVVERGVCYHIERERERGGKTQRGARCKQVNRMEE